MLKSKMWIMFVLCFGLPAVCLAQEPVSSRLDWKAQAEKFVELVTNNSLGNGFALSFSGIYLDYTIDAKGTARISYSENGPILGDAGKRNNFLLTEAWAAGGYQMGQRAAKTIKVGPEKVIELCKLIATLGFDNLLQSQGMIYDDASIEVSLVLDGKETRVGWWHSEREKEFFHNRQVEDCLNGFGEWLAVKAGLRDGAKPIVPICAINALEEVDSDKDGLIDWLKLSLDFYSFSSQVLNCRLFYDQKRITVPSGHSQHDFWVNAYSLKNSEDFGYAMVNFEDFGGWSEFAFLPPFTVKREKLRATPDFLIKGKGLIAEGKAYLPFRVKTGQAVFVRTSRKGYVGRWDMSDHYWYLLVTEIAPDKVKFADWPDETITSRQSLASCSPNSFLRLVSTCADTAVFEIGYNRQGDQITEEELSVVYSSPPEPLGPLQPEDPVSFVD